ncbi:NMCC_0638 family (lipo)protein [Rhizosaccharibacter radicis]|uniref:Uncharacterized protein n=1 Tax=Rhizosaccharibacter radicis TaxID=2782605 RepID=A0ABT1W063_9PROT|nr:hypothetical protein [Acetobacteraceae bacterium KSS12]
MLPTVQAIPGRSVRLVGAAVPPRFIAVGASRAPGASDTPRDPAALRTASHALSALFEQSCLPHAGDPAGLRALLRDRHLSPLPEAAARKALARPGQAFAVPGPGHLMVLSFDDGWCGAGADAVDPHALTLSLSAAVERRGLSMQLMGAGTDGREQRYLLARDTGPRRQTAAPSLALLVLMQPTATPGAMQANLFISPLPSDPGEDHP